MSTAIAFADLRDADLIVDAVYEGGQRGNAADDPIDPLVGGGNQGGIRFEGSLKKDDVKLIVLYSAMDDVDWPDSLDHETGIFYYYGDNKEPGRELHDTAKGGNRLLRTIFERAHQGPEGRKHIPPIFVFTRSGKGKDVVFRGVAIPGSESIPSTEDLVAVWKSVEEKRFQNYRAIFTILDIQKVARAWIKDLKAGTPVSQNCPKAWKDWVLGRVARPLKAPRTLQYRSKKEQLPASKHEKQILERIRRYFKDSPHDFEVFTAELLRMAEKNITRIEVTRPYRDRGRDAIGEYRLSLGKDRIVLDFAVEAKCYGENDSVGVKETSRLISRLRHRQFGFFVTTSYVAQQAYEEIREDKHPIIVISGGDITNILIENGVNTIESLERFLQAVSPLKEKPQG